MTNDQTLKFYVTLIFETLERSVWCLSKALIVKHGDIMFCEILVIIIRILKDKDFK